MASQLVKRVVVSLPRETVMLLRQAAKEQHVSVEEYACYMLTKMAREQLGVESPEEPKQAPPYQET